MVQGLFDVLITIMRGLPYPVYRALTGPIIRLVYLFSPKLRRYAQESLTIAFGDSLSPREKSRLSAVSFRSLMRGLMDAPYQAAHPGFASRCFELKGGEHLTAARSRGRGAVVVVAHFGPFVAMLYRLISEGYPIKIVMRPPRSAAWRRTLYHHPHVPGPQLIYTNPLAECVRVCRKTLQDNELLVMPIDQNYGGPGRVFVDFFGRKAATAAGPAGFAYRMGASLLTAIARPLSPGRWELVIEPVALDRSRDERQAVREATQRLTSWVEDNARRYPGEWSWMHRRWKTVPKPNEV